MRAVDRVAALQEELRQVRETINEHYSSNIRCASQQPVDQNLLRREAELDAELRAWRLATP